jgi:hypothetical protein
MAAFTSVTGAAYADAAGRSIFCTVGIAGYPGVHPYLAVDGDATSQALFDALKAGTYGSVAAYVAPVPPAPTVDQLRAYASNKADALRAVARSYTLTGGLVVMCDSTQGTGADLIGLNNWGTANPSATTNFVQNNGGVVTLTGAQCAALANAVLAYGQSLFAALALAMNGIDNATIATTAAIDALAWPV